MKKSLLLVMLLACISFMGNSISAQQQVGIAHYKMGSGDFHFNNNEMPCEVYGFTDVSPIVTNIGFGSKWLRFSIPAEFMEDIAYMAKRNSGFYDIVVLCRNTWWGGNKGYIRLYIN